MSSTISKLNIDNLKFFTGTGSQIIMQKQYSVQWEIIPADCIYNAFLKNPKGHIECAMSTDITDSVMTTAYNAVMNMYMSPNISLKDNTLYIAELPVNSRIYFYEKNNKQLSEYTKYINTEGQTKFAYSKSSLDASYFRIAFPSNPQTTDIHVLLTEQPATAYIVVDEPGEIQPTVTFTHKSVNSTASGYECLKGYEYSENNGISTGIALSVKKPGKINGYEETLTNIFDIIFFSYEWKYDGSSSVQTMENAIRIYVNDGKENATAEFPLRDFLSTTTNRARLNNLLTFNANNPYGSDKPYHMYGITSDIFTQVLVNDTRTDFLDDEKAYAGNQTSAFYILNNNIPESEFPYMKYIGKLWQDKTSAGIVSADTLIVVNDNGTTTSDMSQKYTYPRVGTEDNEYRFHFRFQTDSEMFFITSDENSEINRLPEYYMLNYSEKLISLGLTQTDTLVNQCMYFTVGFTSDMEGCYKNTMGIFLRDDESEKDYFIGAVQIMTEVIDEDERYRTLFTNFGIPDPIKYNNVFRHSDPNDTAVDWRTVNEKSKQLFLSYDSIFPYGGTYKALFNAMKYLGYQDVVFKEWYRIKDSNDTDRYVAVQNYDMKTGKSIPTILKKYGVEFGEYDRYTKLNRLAMVYHLQEIDELSSEEDLTMYTSSGAVYNTTVLKNKYYNNKDISKVIELYEFRSDEVLAKLYSVKQWLERYITGVNCYISDITGEYIAIERVKALSYATAAQYVDFTKAGHFTPKCISISEFKDSESIIGCSLNEFNSLTFDDCKDYIISDFIKDEYTVNTDQGNSLTVYDSAPIGALTIADEYMFHLETENAVGSLYEFTDKNYLDNPILIKDGEIVFWNQKKRLSKIDSMELPVIQINKGNIRSAGGSWSSRNSENSNVLWSIFETRDADTGESFCVLHDIRTGAEMRTKGFVNLSPKYQADGTTGSDFFYSADNNWELPLFFFKDYYVSNENKADVYSTGGNSNNTLKMNPENEYIIEIIEGSIRFMNKKDISSDVEKKYCKGCEIVFEESGKTPGEQKIYVRYEYESDRVPIYTFSEDGVSSLSGKSISQIMTELNELVVINDTVDIPVNRLGEYAVSVKAFDPYNNMYTNVSDKTYDVTAQEPNIYVIVNKHESDNDIDFYQDNAVYPDERIKSLSKSEVDNILSKVTDTPVFPISYKIYNDEHKEDDGNTVYYDSISYALDTPKANDYIVLTNMTERADISSVDNSNMSLKLRSSNMFKQNILQISGKVNLCIFDDNSQQSLYATDYPVIVDDVSDLSDSITESGISGISQSGHIDYVGILTLDISSLNADDIEKLKSLKDSVNDDNNINLYIINANECPIDIEHDIVNWIDDEGNKRAFIPIMKHDDNHNDDSISGVEESYSIDKMLRAFPIDSMIKIRICDENMTIIGECAYRIIGTDKHIYIDNRHPENNEVTMCGYIIDGNVDLTFIKEADNVNVYDEYQNNNGCGVFDRKSLKYVLKPIHDKAVQYYMRVNNDAVEVSYMYDKPGFYSILTEIDYNPNQLLFDSYFDDSYALNIYGYDPMSLYDIWYVNTDDEWRNNLYEYKNFPVTVDRNMNVIVMTDDDCNQLEGSQNDECVKLWRWKVRAIEDRSNWKNMNSVYDNIVLFESCSDVLSVKPYMSGSQSIELFCYDRYGNSISNTRGGNIFVRDISAGEKFENDMMRKSFVRILR